MDKQYETADPLVLSAKRIEGRSHNHRTSIRRAMPSYSALAGSFAAGLLLLVTPCWAHGEELGHHWETPAYRVEMQTQILLMTGVAVAVVAACYVAKVVRARRSGQ